ncbi:TetR/AcrR family transcriptional regulator [Flavihumibacter profundi]|uniref:TetR/AcrR family transcriptional regulator n=1 Tax=Flavihumibacter profundi TaxID=2716883 RepID=UPI001CC3C993|nr:TetR/AcrR family transcriptional regulator [Flavihumibacter profundi]MBZ5858673.1 TetR/AcrR family transcriptional regulator [Flavihumibacter profundi]
MADLDNKERILTKSRELFMQYGIRSISMDDIASSMGMSKKTIYQYFADKDELVNAVIQFKVCESEEFCNHDRIVSENAIDEIFRTMEMVEQMFRTMNPSVLFDLKKYHPLAYSQIEKHQNEYIFNVIRTNLERGIREELYRPEININIIAHFRVRSAMLPFDPTFLAEQKANLATIEQQIMEHYLFGIVTLKGYKLILKYQQKRQKT